MDLEVEQSVTLLSPTDLHRKHTESETEDSNKQIKHATLHKQTHRAGTNWEHIQ